MARPEPGTRIGQYVVRSVLGQGGMGVVLRARDERLGRDVALKMLLGVPDAEARDRLLAEARAAARLHHPGIAQVHEVAVHEGELVIALELVEGRSLAALVAERGPFAPHEAAVLVKEVALAVAHAHAAGVIHRDLKPANVLVATDGKPRLVDFGLARQADASKQTQTGAILGTPAYMAPEQAQGGGEAVGPWTDVYGLCAVLYELLAGRPPFDETGFALLRAVIEEEPEPPSRVRLARARAALPRDLETICLMGLEKRPARRHRSAAALAAELERFLAGEPIAARAPTRRERATRWLARHRALALACGVALVCALVAGATFATASVKAARQREEDRARLIRVDALLGRATDRIILGEYQSALALASEAAALDPTLARPYLVRAQARAKLSQAAGVIADATLALERDPQLLPAYLERSAARIATGDLAGAEKDAGDAIRCDPAFSVAWTQRASIRVMRHDLRGALADASQGFELAAGEFAKARALVARAQAKLGLGDPVGSEDDVTRATHLETNMPDAWDLLAVLHLGRGRAAEARAAADVALGLAPNLKNALRTRARARGELGDAAGARDDATRLIELDPRDPVGWATRALAKGDLHDDASALADAEECLRLDPNDAVGFFARGKSRIRLGDNAGAVADLERFLELADPTDARIPMAREAVEKLR